MNGTVPKIGQKARLLATLYGVVVFLWLTPEDNGVLPVTLLGTGLAVIMVALGVMNTFGGSSLQARYLLPAAALAGALAGLAASLTVAGLMLLKNAMHAHIFLDFPPGMLLAILERAPVWAAAGALAGLGLALAWAAWRSEKKERYDR